MAITVNSQPADYRLSRDPLTFQVTGDQYVITPGAYHLFSFTFTTEPAIGNTLLVESPVFNPLGGKTFTFVDAVGGYVFDGENIRIRTGLVTLANWFEQSLIPGLMADPDFAAHYEIYVDGSTVHVRAIEYGPDYNFSEFTPTGFTLGGPSPVAGVLPAFRDGYFIKARVNVETEHLSTVFERSPWFFFRPNETGQIAVDLAPKIDEMIEWTAMISNAQTAPIRRRAELRRFYVEFAEEYETEDMLPIRRTNIRNIMKGSSRDFLQTSAILLSRYNANVFLNAQSQSSFAGENANVTRNMLHHLFCIIRWTFESIPEASPLRARARVFYIDGSSLTQTLGTLTDASTGQLWAIQAGFMSNGLAALSAVEPYAYEIEVFDAFGTIVCQPYRFRLADDHAGMNVRYVQYINRFGVAQTRLLLGSQIEESTPVRESMRTARSIPIVANDADDLSHSIFESTRLIVGSQAFSNWSSDEFLDLLMSPMHLVTDRSESTTNFVPATILNKSEVLRSYDHDGNNMRAISLEFKLNTRR